MVSSLEKPRERYEIELTEFVRHEVEAVRMFKHKGTADERDDRCDRTAGAGAKAPLMAWYSARLRGS